MNEQIWRGLASYFGRVTVRLLIVIFLFLLALHAAFFTFSVPGSEMMRLRDQRETDNNLLTMTDVENLVPKNNDGRQIVVIVSSMPRSGSTTFGELISTASDDLVYYFEPDQFIEDNKCLQKEACALDFFRNIYLCKTDDTFTKWFKEKKLFFQFYNRKGSMCTHMKSSLYKDCIQSIDLTSDCINTKTLIIKNIRTRLKLIGRLLQDKGINMKIVLLVRDPRGALVSIRPFHWGVPESTRCKGQLEDLKIFEKLKQMYPNQVTSITYESLCLDPFAETERIFGFIFGSNILPENTKTYITNHYFPKKEIPGSMSTVKDSKSHIDSWRFKIEESHLSSVENEPSCKATIRKMKHRLFGSKQNAVNKSVSLFSSNSDYS